MKKREHDVEHEELGPEEDPAEALGGVKERSPQQQGTAFPGPASSPRMASEPQVEAKPKLLPPRRSVPSRTQQQLLLRRSPARARGKPGALVLLLRVLLLPARPRQQIHSLRGGVTAHSYKGLRLSMSRGPASLVAVTDDVIDTDLRALRLYSWCTEPATLRTTGWRGASIGAHAAANPVIAAAAAAAPSSSALPTASNVAAVPPVMLPPAKEAAPEDT